MSPERFGVTRIRAQQIAAEPDTLEEARKQIRTFFSDLTTSPEQHEQYGIILIRQAVALLREQMKGDRDEISSVLNIAGFRHEFAAIIEMERQRERLIGPEAIRNYCITVVDVNNLKETNDIYGTLEGDKLLRKTAGFLTEQDSCRLDLDLRTVARDRGDRFTTLLWNSNLQDGIEWWQRVNEALEKHAISVSGGAVELDVHNPEASLKNVDSLYRQAKKITHTNTHTSTFLLPDGRVFTGTLPVRNYRGES